MPRKSAFNPELLLFPRLTSGYIPDVPNNWLMAESMLGKTLNHYEVLETLGEGGMGEVYRARDTKLARDVAIKVLPAHMADDPERLARMQREAQLLAALNHPNIAAIYGLEEDGEVQFLAMELAEGQTLAQRLSDGALSVDEALKIALQIAEALEAAHERGIVHRDLKPANIQVGTEGSSAGQVKVLDFGLAKAYEADGASSEMSPDLSASPTMAAATRTGVIMGTAAYMSPEQARGKPLDKRTDIWAFGCVVFEMLTGKPAFPGETVTDILAAIVHQEPQWEALPAETPLRIRELLSRCLKKPPEERLRDVGECRIAIKEYLADPEGQRKRALAVSGVVGTSLGAWRVAIPVAATALVVGALGTWALLGAGDAPPRIERFDLNPPPIRTSASYLLAISPDGADVVISSVGPAGPQLWHRRVDELEATPLAGTEGSWNPFFSPGGDWVGFFTTDALKKVPLTGGPPVDICACQGGNFAVATWLDDDTIMFGARDGLWSVGTERGSEPEMFLRVDAVPGSTGLMNPTAIRGTEWVLFTIWEPPGDIEDDVVAMVSLESKEVRRLYTGGTHPAYASSGHLLFMQVDQTLAALPFDLASGEVRSVPTSFASIDIESRAWSISRNGTLVYVLGSPDTAANRPRRLAWVDREGGVIRTTSYESAIVGFALAPDETRVAARTDWRGAGPLMVVDLDREVGFEVAARARGVGVWSSDSESLLIMADSRQERIFPGTSRAAEQFDKGIFVPTTTSSDGRLVGGTTLSPQGGIDIAIIDFDEPADVPVTEIAIPGDQRGARLSPDGRWLLFESGESGEREIWLQSYPDDDVRLRVSPDGGADPQFSRAGDEIYYFSPLQDLMAVSFDPGVDPILGRPTALFPAGDRFLTAVLGSTDAYAPTADGNFLMIARGDLEPGGGREVTSPRIVMVKGFFEELKRLVPTGR